MAYEKLNLSNGTVLTAEHTARFEAGIENSGGIGKTCPKCVVAVEYGHAEGSNTKAIGDCSHAEGYYTEASGDASHAEGYYTEASGDYSHSEGYYTQAQGQSSHAEGHHTIAARDYQHVLGWWNEVDVGGNFANGNGNAGQYVVIVGKGLSEDNRRNIFTLAWSGIPWCSADRIMLGGTSMNDENAVALMPIFAPQQLTPEQKQQARANIGAAAIGEGGGGTLEGAVLYTEQTLTEEQQQQACTNIGTKKTVIMEVTLGDYIQSGYGGEYTVESASMTYDEVREAVNAGANVECHVSWPEDLPGPEVLLFNHMSEEQGYCEFSAYVGGGDVAYAYNCMLEPDGVCWLQIQALLTDERMDKVYLSTEREQSFTEEQKAQGRANLGIDEYIDQVFLGGAW